MNKVLHVLGDQTIRLTGVRSVKAYPKPLRRVKYRSPDSDELYEFLTNNFELPPEIIAQLYKQRWQVELFFKWIKQYLRIKSFFGTSGNAVRIQVWTAISAYLLLAILKKRLGLPHELYEMAQILRPHLFEPPPLFYRCFSTRHLKFRPPHLINSCHYPTNIRTAVIQSTESRWCGFSSYGT